MKNNESRKLVHYNFLNWPDFGTPDVYYAIIDDIVDKITEIEDNERSKSKVVVHCSAGIGRTGTLIAIYNLVSTIQHYISTNNTENGKLSVFAIVRRLREQRYHMVHNELQYEFIYKFINYRLNIMNVSNNQNFESTIK